MASLLGNLIFAGLQTLLTTQASLGASANLYSINTGAQQSLDTSLFMPAFAGVANAGLPGCTLPPVLFTRTSTTAVFLNPNTTAMPGEILAAFWHSRIR